jgi:hypothetical protein
MYSWRGSIVVISKVIISKAIIGIVVLSSGRVPCLILCPIATFESSLSQIYVRLTSNFIYRLYNKLKSEPQ